MSNFIVTGGAGFIGSHLTDHLIKLGHRVIVIDNLMLGKKEFINPKAKFYNLDIRHFIKIQPIFKNVDAVFHLAADPRLPVSLEKPRQTHEINVTGTLNVLLAAKNNGVKKVIFSSSCAVYGDQHVPYKESSQPNPLSPYGLHKLMGEQYCQLFSNLFGLATVCLRYFNVFGPRKLATGSYPMVIPIFLRQKKLNQPLTIVGDGKNSRDYVHVSDVVTANILAWKAKVNNGQAINIGSGRQISVNEIAKIIGGKSINIPARQGEMRYVMADNKKAKKELGWSPKVKFEQGIKELLQQKPLGQLVRAE